MYKKIVLAISIIIGIVACNNSNNAPNITAVFAVSKSAENNLSMKINGKEWIADNGIFGAFDPDGYNKAILIAGNKGGADKNQQAFNINVYNITTPGQYDIVEGNDNNSVVQLANITNENYLYGSMMGFTMKINVTKCSKSPSIIEATLTGELGGNASDKILITEGKFSYQE